MACIQRLLAAVVLLLVTSALVSGAFNESSIHKSRKKRLIYLTSERRLTLPPTTLLVLTPTLSLPVARNLPTGYGASMTISIPFKVAFDDLGLTSEENPWGLWPEIFRKKRDTFSPMPGINWAGGDREMMYQVVEDALHNMGLDGKACLMRAICEVFQLPLVNHGFFGEVLELFLSASRSPHADKRLSDYARAERIGRSTGECFDYHLACPFSLFTNPGELHWEDVEDMVQGNDSSDSSSSDFSEPMDPVQDSDRSTSDEDIQEDKSATKKAEDEILNEKSTEKADDPKSTESTKRKEDKSN